MRIGSKFKTVILTGILALSLGGAACEADNSKVSVGNNSSSERDTGGGSGGNNGTPDVREPGEDTTPPEQPGADADQFVPGLMHGHWTVRSVEDDGHIAEFSLVHEEGDSHVYGNFLAGDGLYDGMVDGGNGELGEGSSFEGDVLTIVWNPTTQVDEEMTITADKVSDDEFKGRMSAVQNTELDMELVLTRVEDDPIDEED